MIENLVWFALCIYFEAMGEQQEGQVAVGHVIMNRVEKTGKSMKDVIIKPWQFSWLNQNRPPVKDYNAFYRADFFEDPVFTRTSLLNPVDFVYVSKKNTPSSGRSGGIPHTFFHDGISSGYQDPGSF